MLDSMVLLQRKSKSPRDMKPAPRGAPVIDAAIPGSGKGGYRSFQVLPNAGSEKEKLFSFMRSVNVPGIGIPQELGPERFGP